jgi:hypothetical protein
MSVNVGDRYACPDPECGCEIEVRTASRSSVMNIETRTSEVLATDTSLRSRGGPNIAAPEISDRREPRARVFLELPEEARQQPRAATAQAPPPHIPVCLRRSQVSGTPLVFAAKKCAKADKARAAHPLLQPAPNRRFAVKAREIMAREV